MRAIARFMDARNTAEGKFLSVLLSVLLVFSFLNVTMFTDLANADDEVALGAATEIVAEIEDDGEVEEAEEAPEAPESPEADAPEAPADEPAEEPSDPVGDDAIEPVPSAPSESDPVEEVTCEGDSGSEGDAVEAPAAADDARAAELNLNAVGERGKKPELSEQNVYVYLQLTGDGVDEFVKDLSIKPNGHGYYTIGVIKAMLPTPTKSMLSTDNAENNYIGDYGEAVRAALRSGIDRWADNAGVDISGIPPEQWNKLIVSNGADRYVNSGTYTWHLDGYMKVENAINYEVRHINEDGNEIEQSESGTTRVGTKITAENHRRSIDGYTYSSEKTQAANGGNEFIEIARGKDNVLTLVYERNTYDVTFDPGEQGTFAPQVTKGIEHGAATPAPPVPTGAPGYRFMGWDPAVADQVTKDATYVAQWAREYRVVYEWTGLPADKVFYDEAGREVTPTLPVDASTYTKGESYQVKEAAVTKVYTHDEFGNRNATYRLSSWYDPENGIMPEADVTVTATWEATPISVPTWNITYQWKGDAPAAAKLPVDSKTYRNNEPFEVEANFFKGCTVNETDAYGNTTGVWTFNGWDTESGRITDDLTIGGSWSYKPQDVPRYNVFYQWTGLPKGEAFYNAAGNEAAPMLPLNLGGLVKGQPFTVDAALPGTELFTHDEFGNVNARYTLGNWNLTGEQTMGEGDVAITAQWTREKISVPKVEVRYVYTNGMNGTPQHAPQPPKNKTYVLNQPLDSVAVPTLEGWEFSGWSIDANEGYTITTEDVRAGVVEITGTWTPLTEGLDAVGYRGVYDGAPHNVAALGLLPDDEVFYRIGGLVAQNRFTNATVTSSNPQGTIVEVVAVRDGVEIWSKNVSVAIAKRPVKIKGEGWAAPQVYTGEEYATTAYTAEQRNGDRGLVSHAKVSGLTYDLAGTAAGSYTGSFGGQVLIKLGTGENVTGNYEVELVHGGLTIEAKNLTDPDVNPEEPTEAAFTVQYESTKVYNGTEQKPEASDILVTDHETGFQLVPGVDYGVYYRPANGVATTPADFVNAGETTIVVYGMGNYQGQFELPYEIIPAPLTVSAAYASKVFGEDDPEFTWTVEGLFSQNGVLDAMGAVTVSRSTGEENAGLYEDELVPAVAEEDRNSNYTYEFVPADFRILQDDENDVVIDGINDVASQSIVKTYDGEVVAIEATAARPEGSTLEYSVDGGEWGAEVPTFLNAGVYEVAVRATNPNYETVEKTVTVVINRAPVTVTAVASGKYFGAADPSLTATVTGLVAGESESLIDYVVAREAGEAVGEYAIVPAGLAIQGNYAVTYETAPFTIAAAPVAPPTVTPNPVNPPTVPTVPTVPTPAPGPAAPAATPAAATPAPAPAAVPAVAPPVLAAPTPAPAVAEPAGEVIEDDATPQAATPSDEAGEQIEDDATPMGAFDEPHCWVHWAMLVGILLTALYGLVVVRRRLGIARDIDDYENEITGLVEARADAPEFAAAHQAL